MIGRLKRTTKDARREVNRGQQRSKEVKVTGTVVDAVIVNSAALFPESVDAFYLILIFFRNVTFLYQLSSKFVGPFAALGIDGTREPSSVKMGILFSNE